MLKQLTDTIQLTPPMNATVPFDTQSVTHLEAGTIIGLRLGQTDVQTNPVLFQGHTVKKA